VTHALLATSEAEEEFNDAWEAFTRTVQDESLLEDPALVAEVVLGDEGVLFALEASRAAHGATRSP